MKRTQLYLDEPLWKALQIRARQEGTTISELVRQAVRERFASAPRQTGAALEAIIGIWKDRDDLPPTEEWVRGARRGRSARR